MDKTIHIGKTRDDGHLFARIKWDGERLSITGVEGPARDGNCRGSCGQIIGHEWDIAGYATGWSPELVRRFRDAWGAWHLNDMQAGSPAQTAYLKANPNCIKVSEALTAAGLNPDPSYLYNGKPYGYGMAWLSVDVPADVIAFLESLPAGDLTPAWV